MKVEKIKTILCFFAAFLAILVNAAHFLRFWNLGYVFTILSFLILMFFSSAWIRKALILNFALCALMWIDLTIDLVQIRMQANENWLRLAIILSAVALYNLFCVHLFDTERIKKYFSQKQESSSLSLAAFCLVFVTFYIIHTKAGHILLFNRIYSGMGILQGLILSLWATYVVGRLSEKSGANAFRMKIWRFFSLVFFLQFFLALLGYTLFMLNQHFHLPVPALIIASPIFRSEGYFMLILFSASILLIGSAWCSYLCYFGVWDAYYTKKIQPMSKVIKGKYFKLLTFSSTLSLLLVVVSSYLLRLFQVPAQTALLLGAFVGILIIPFNFMFSRKYGFTSYCYALCPLGAISTRIRSLLFFFTWKIKFSEACTLCGKCIRACNYMAIDKNAFIAKRAHSSCTLCLNCVNVCPHNACILELKPFSLSAQRAKEIFLVLIASFHATFLGVAMI